MSKTATNLFKNDEENHTIVTWGIKICYVAPKIANLGNKMGLMEHFGANFQQLEANLELT